MKNRSSNPPSAVKTPRRIRNAAPHAPNTYADATNAADPSDDPLSTTMTSKDGAAACAASAWRQPGSHGRPLQFRTMTLIRGEDGEGTSHDNSREVTRGAPSSGGWNRGEDVFTQRSQRKRARGGRGLLNRSAVWQPLIQLSSPRDSAPPRLGVKSSS